MNQMRSVYILVYFFHTIYDLHVVKFGCSCNNMPDLFQLVGCIYPILRKARLFLLVDLREFLFRSRVGGGGGRKK